MVFENRLEAGKKLGAELYLYRQENPFILALPRGGVPIAYEIAKILQAPLDVLVVRKIGLSSNREFGIGAIAEGDVQIVDDDTLRTIGVDEEELKDTLKLEKKELQRRVEIYRGHRPLPDLTGRTVILVDDGMATGMTARAAIESVKKLHPQKIILAMPVCAFDIVENLRSMVNGVICLATPYEFIAVGAWYRDFSQVSDREVVDLLKQVNTLGTQL